MGPYARLVAHSRTCRQRLTCHVCADDRAWSLRNLTFVGRS